MTTAPRAAAAFAVLALAGCGPATADVAGKVTYQGKPVVFGSVVVIGANGIPKSGSIQPDGSYRVSGVATGPGQVAVSSPMPPGLAPVKKRAARDDDEKPPADAGKSVSPDIAKAWVALPEKYSDPAKSGLTAQVGSGQPLDLELK